MNTTASAQGNASAQLYVMASAPPDDTPFKNWLTDDEIQKHAYFNDDILNIAEDIDEIEARLATTRNEYNIREPAWDDSVSAADRIAYYTDGGNADDGMDDGRANRIVNDLRSISELEDDILAELDEVRSEYIALAANLNAGRVNYVNHYLQAQALTAQFPNVTRAEVQRSGIGPGPVGAMATHDAQMSSYEATYHDYKMIEEGFKHTTVRETLTALAWGAVALIVTEIATFGIAKFVTIGAAAIRLTTVGRTLARAGDIGAALIARFMALTEATRRRVVNVVRRGRRNEPEYPGNGRTNTGQAGQAARPRCATGACAL